LTIDGAGITNNSGVTQNFVSTVSSQPIRFVQSASAGNQTTFTNSHGYIEFRDTANPGTATFVTSNGGITIFFDQAKSDNGTFIANSGGTTYPDFHHGANGTCISNPGGTTYLGIGDRAGNATFIANGGEIIFDAFSNGDTARVEIFGNGLLYTADSFDLTLGSIEGDGIIELGDDGLKVGSNNLITVFAGQIRDTNSEIFGATLVKEGSGSLTLSSRNLYRNGTVVLDGTLVINNTTGSGTGAGAVQVNQGILAGSGIISGAVTVGTGGGAGAFLAPGKGSSTATTLTIQSTVTFKADSIYTYRLNTKSAEADQVVAHGVTIESGAQFDFVAVANKRLTPGTVFTAISNTSANPISGVFANLPDDSTFTVGRNTFQADYQGGDGNDLTLTVVP
jgi:autotransporter-associated beta strand protein